MSRRRIRRRTLGSGAAALAAAVGSYLLVRSGRGAGLDARVAEVVGRPRGSATDRVVATSTDIGSIYGLAGVSAALWMSGRRGAAADVAGAGAIAWTVAQGAKPLLARERPFEIPGTDRLVAVPAGSSWPSGHAAVATAMATTLAPRVDGVARLAVATAAFGVGLSRLYVGVHHLTDVVAGWGLGALSTTAWQLVRRRP